MEPVRLLLLLAVVCHQSRFSIQRRYGNDNVIIDGGKVTVLFLMHYFYALKIYCNVCECVSSYSSSIIVFVINALLFSSNCQ